MARTVKVSLGRRIGSSLLSGMISSRKFTSPAKQFFCKLMISLFGRSNRTRFGRCMKAFSGTTVISLSARFSWVARLEMFMGSRAILRALQSNANLASPSELCDSSLWWHSSLVDSLGYPGSVRWQHSTHTHSTPPGEKKRSAFVTALPQIRVETLIGSQANYELNIKITIMISYEKYSTSKLY